MLFRSLPPVPTRLIEIGQARPVPTTGTVSLPSALPYPAHCHPPSASVTQTVPPPAHSHYTRASVHTYSNLPTSTASQSYLNVPVLSTATVTTSATSRPHVHYMPEHSVVEQTVRDSTLASAVSTVQPAVATYAPMTRVISAAPSTAASVLPSASAVPIAATPAPVIFKQLQQPRTYNGSRLLHP